KTNYTFTITYTVICNYKYVKFQNEPYYCSQNINKLTPKKIIEKWNESVANFMIANIQKFVSMYDGQQGGYKLEDIKGHVVELPLKNGEIYFEFIEEIMQEIELEHINKVDSYLVNTGLIDCELTEAEKKVVNFYEDIEWK